MNSGTVNSITLFPNRLFNHHENCSRDDDGLYLSEFRLASFMMLQLVTWVLLYRRMKKTLDASTQLT